jgi:hypothetical protein
MDATTVAVDLAKMSSKWPWRPTSVNAVDQMFLLTYGRSPYATRQASERHRGGDAFAGTPAKARAPTDDTPHMERQAQPPAVRLQP